MCAALPTSPKSGKFRSCIVEVRGLISEPLFNPFPAPGIQSVRPSGSSGRGERPRGPPDPPDGSPGPGEQKEGGHQQTRLPIRPSCLSGLDGGCPASRHAQTANHGTNLSNPAASLATARCPYIRSNTCEKGFWTVPKPCWLKRAQLLVAARSSRRPTKVGPRDREVARGPAFGVGMRAGAALNA